MNSSEKKDHQQTTDSYVNITGIVYKLLDKTILIILAAVLGAFLVGVGMSRISGTTYTSTAKLYLVNTEEETVSMYDLQAMNYLVYDYLAAFQTQELHQRVSEEAGLNYTATQLSGMVTAENIEETHILSITVQAKTVEDAVLLANTYADVTGSFAAEKFNVPKPNVFEEAISAVKSGASGEKRNYILGAMGGLFIACIAVVLDAVFDDRIYTPEDLQNAVGIETLGIMTKQKKRHTAQKQSGSK